MKQLAASSFVSTIPGLALPKASRRSTRAVQVLDSGWLFQKETPGPLPILHAGLPQYDDGTWESVGVPHCYNDLDTYQNADTSQTFRGNAWYRKHFSLSNTSRGKRIYLEFESVNIACAVYVNGHFKPGNTAVKQPGNVTHVGSFLPFALDITNDVIFGDGNVLAVRVSNLEAESADKNPTTTTSAGAVLNPEDPSAYERARQKKAAFELFHSDPGFGTSIDFGMGFGGIVGPVRLHIVDPIHIPLNTYSPLGKWGTYADTVAANQDVAKVRIQTNIENSGPTTEDVHLITQIVEEGGNVVTTLRSDKYSIAPGQIQLVDQTAQVSNPRLWFPNASPYGKPYLYSIVSSVYCGGRICNTAETPLGIRIVTWDADYCYINGKKHILNGFGNRNIYPALGSAVPAELQWNDIRLVAECGGNALRVGHVPATRETVRACDAYGVLVMQNSGDNEWSLSGEPNFTYKNEYDRDCIIAYRNHPSVVIWESNNGLAVRRKPIRNPLYSPRNTIEIADRWDYIQPRIVMSRDTSDYWPKDRRLMIGYTNSYSKVNGSPSLNLEVYGAKWGKGERSFGIARFDYDHERAFAEYYVNDYFKDLEKRACGWIDWMLAETQGESYVTYLNGMSKQKSLGSCAMDGNRLPKLTYQVFKSALWIPYSLRPGVTLQSHWNLSGVQNICAWSNCPMVELRLNGKSFGIRTTDSKHQCVWEGVEWQAGSLEAFGMGLDKTVVCIDRRITAGPPHRIELKIENGLRKPGGERFTVHANQTDVIIVTATIVDSNGIWCPLADQSIRFEVKGSCVYKGSYNFYVAEGKPLTYHAPGDHELQAEGGRMRIAIRSGATPGKIVVSAFSAGLISGEAATSTLPTPHDHRS
jgi:beta-galactosidase